ncbi:HAD-IA family hydrolase [Bacillus niameyensis]|uniref:HAD-IA family hydrolase n=1 Tax=Bacillus niameyensis TaxID=1522308 RepID=UPI0007808E40|nr:HAD-IA family hydrolase [Bacillus niameyensis]
MFTYCHSDFNIFLDLTGPDGWQENRDFLEKMKQLSKKKSVTYASEALIEDTESRMYPFNPEGLPTDIGWIVYEDLDTDETGVLIISNNIDHMKHYVEYGFSTVYLQTENCQLDFDTTVMPDEVWDYDNFNSFADHPNLRFTYSSELLGFPNKAELKSKLFKLSNKLRIPNTDWEADIIFTGRYFTSKDNRHYHHPLSRAILGFKKDRFNQRDVVKKVLGKTIGEYLNSDDTVTHIAIVPPRPNKESRFIGMEEFMDADIKVEHDLLESVNDYDSPGKYPTFNEKYQHVYDNIKCTKKISGHVLLVDDVFTSGATTAECARVLYKEGASKVTILPLAFTQHFNYYEQSVMPVIFNSDGNEYHLRFRNSDHQVFWSSKKDNGEFDSKNFEIINQEYVDYHGHWSAKKVEVQEYSADKEIQAIIFDLDNTLLQTDHLESYRLQRTAIKDTSLIKKEHIIIQPDILAELQRANIKVGIVTRSPRNYAKSLLAAYGYTYDCLIASLDTLRSKPAPDPLLKCAIKLKIKPEYIVNIGDQKTDLQAGNKAGMMSLHIDTVLDDNVLIRTLNRYAPLEF